MKLHTLLFFTLFLLSYTVNTYTMQEQSFYDILGIPNTASKEEITKAYRKLALKWHPDRNPAPEARDKFEKITQAYETLTDVKKRSKYDEELKRSKLFAPSQPKQQPTSKQLEIQKILLNKQLAARREKDIDRKGTIAKEIVSIIDTNNITDDISINKALTLLYEIAKQYFKNDKYEYAAKFQTLGFEKAIKWGNQNQKKKFKHLKEKHKREETFKQKKAELAKEFSKIKEERSREEKEIKEKIDSYIAQSEATNHLREFISAKKTNEKEKHIHEAINAIKNHRFIDPIIKETILKNLLELTNSFYQKKDNEKQIEYARLGLAQAQQFGFDIYENQFEQFLPKKSPIQIPQKTLLQELEELYRTLTNLEKALSIK